SPSASSRPLQRAREPPTRKEMIVRQIVAPLCGALVMIVIASAKPQAAEDGWIDLMPGKELKGWKRVPIPPDVKLADKNPWSINPETKNLICDGVGIKEMLLYEREFGDGVFHLEWRFKKIEGGKDYNSGVYVRTTGDGKVWHQAQVAHVDKPPRLGDLFTAGAGGQLKVLSEGTGHKLARPVGEWNTYDVACTGKTITVRVNGKLATTWKECAVPKGHVGLQAEFFYIEFRNLKFKETN